MRNPGCRIKWDLAKARTMWIEGVKVREIGKTVGASESAINGASIRWNWPARVKPESSSPTRRMVMKRCPSCWARYRAMPLDTTPHVCEHTARPRSLYEYAA